MVSSTRSARVQRAIDVTLVLGALGAQADLSIRQFGAAGSGRWPSVIALALTFAVAASLRRGPHLVAAAGVGLLMLTSVTLGIAMHEAPGPHAVGPLGLGAHEAIAPIFLVHVALLGVAAREVARWNVPAVLAAAAPVPVLYAVAGALVRVVRGPRPDGVLGGIDGPILLQPGAVLAFVVVPLITLLVLGIDVVRAWRTRIVRPLVRDAGLFASALVCVSFAALIGHARGDITFDRWPAMVAAMDSIPVNGWWSGLEETDHDDDGVEPRPLPDMPERPLTPPSPEPTTEPAPDTAPAVPPAAAPPPASFPARTATPTNEDDLRAFDLAAAALGGTIAQGPKDPDGSRTGHDVQDLLVGSRAGWAVYDFQLPERVVLAFRGGDGIRADRVVLDTHFQIPITSWEELFTPANRAREVTLAYSDVGPDGPFTPLGAFTIPEDARHVTLAFPSVTLRALEVRLLSGHGGGEVGLGRIHVMEARDVERSALAGTELDLARADLGGGVVRFTSQASEEEGAWRLVDGRAEGWTSADGALPQDLVFGFARGGAAAVRAVELSTADGVGAPCDVEVAVSETSPLDGLRVVAAGRLDARGGRIAIDPPAVGRYLRVRVTSRHGGSRTRLGEVRIIEAAHGKDGYRSLLAGHGAALPPRPALDTVGPIDTLELGVSIEGRGEVAHYSLSVPDGDLRAVNLALEGLPTLRSAVAVRDAAGRVVASFDPAQATAAVATLTFVSRGGRYTVDVREPPSSVVVVYDVSRSMLKDIGALEQALRAFVARVQPDEEMALLAFSGVRAELRCDFTSDAERLARSLDAGFELHGGTPFYEALVSAHELLARRTGNRAIVVFTDGADTTSDRSYADLWRRLAAARVRTYCVGLGGGLEALARKQGCTGLAGLRAIADGSGARLWHARTADALSGVYDEVSAELHGPPSYRLRVDLSAGTGRLAFESEQEGDSGVAPRLELLLDGSGSMAEPLGGYRWESSVDADGNIVADLANLGTAKIDLARAALGRVLSSLPDGVHVALRTFSTDAADRPRTDLIQPLTPLTALGRARLRTLADRVRPGGKTPIALALAAVAADLGRGEGPRIVVLLSDGKETCGGDPAAEARRLVGLGVEVRVHMVGFDVAEGERDGLRQIAEAAGGTFWLADDGDALEEALARAVMTTFRVEDVNGVVVVRDQLGEECVLPVGTFRVVIEGEEPRVIEGVQIRAGETTRLSAGR
jgi:Mg-chelatase subunit ChlD